MSITMMSLLILFMPYALSADRSVMQLHALGKLNVWFAMQLPLFVKWPNMDQKQSAHASDPMLTPVVNFCLDIADPQRFFLNEEKKNQRIAYAFDVKLIENVAQLHQCHILIIHKSQEYRLSSLLLMIKNRPILTVSDIENFAEKGGMIGLFVERDRLRYVCNLRAARESGLKISSRVLELADSVYE